MIESSHVPLDSTLFGLVAKTLVTKTLNTHATLSMVESLFGPLDSTLCGLAANTLVAKTLDTDTQHFPR